MLQWENSITTLRPACRSIHLTEILFNITPGSAINQPGLRLNAVQGKSPSMEAGDLRIDRPGQTGLRQKPEQHLLRLGGEPQEGHLFFHLLPGSIPPKVAVDPCGCR